MNASLTIQPMTSLAFEKYLEYGIKEYAKDKMKSLQIDWEQALDLSKESMANGLPDGLATPDNYLYTAFDSVGAEIGTLWIAVQTNWERTTLFIYDIEITPAYRRKGYGAALMAEAEKQAGKFGATKVALHVFGHNKPAKDLYVRLGYRITDISMAKSIC